MRPKHAKVVVIVNGSQWQAVSGFRGAGPNDAIFTLNGETGSITFGDGVNGAKPPIGSVVTISYHYGSGSEGNISKRIDDDCELTKFWVIVRDGEQSVGWGCSKKTSRAISQPLELSKKFQGGIAMVRKPLTNPRPRRKRGKPRKEKGQWRPNYRAFEKEIREYFEERQKRLEIAATTRTPSGQVLDWIPIESQLSNEKIADPPPEAEGHIPRGKRRVALAKFELEHPAAQCGPKGTVPVLRKDLSKIRIVRSLGEYLSKHGRRPSRHVRLDNGFYLLLPDSAGNHHYTSTSQNITCFGGEGNISAFDPYTGSSTDFSLMQIGLANDDTGKRQTVEAGWQEYQQEYGDWVPHLFVFYTTNGYSENGDNKGGYNQDVDGWVQYDNSIYPGATSSPNSAPGGTQYILQIKYQLYNSNWWFRCNGRWIGYYPASLFMGNQSVFSTLGDHASTIGFWGEIGDVNEPTKTQMGSGYWAEDGWTYSAFQSNLMVQTDRGGGLNDYDGGSGWTSDPSLWDVITDMKSGTSWGSYFWMGGPGNN